MTGPFWLMWAKYRMGSSPCPVDRHGWRSMPFRLPLLPLCHLELTIGKDAQPRDLVRADDQPPERGAVGGDRSWVLTRIVAADAPGFRAGEA
jgi:hypothetical protein